MLKSIFLAAFLTTSFSISSINAFEIREDDQYVYITRGLNELPDDRLRALMDHYYARLSHEFNKLGVPPTWTDETHDLLMKDQQHFSNILQQTQQWANKYMDDQSISMADLIPTGFILGLGVDTSLEMLLGVGGGALLTLIIVPQEVERFDKVTQETTHYFEASWSIGGLAQWAVSAGTGGSLAVSGAFGIIWGALPEADDLTGIALGVNGKVSFVQGLGLKALLLFNSTTHHHNLISMVTLDLGASANASIEASMSYFMPAKHIIAYLSHGQIKDSKGNDQIVFDPQTLPGDVPASLDDSLTPATQN